jgi:hypothetical protein
MKELKPLEEYPAWLAKLMQPQPSLRQKLVLMSLEDTDAFLPDVGDLKSFRNQNRRKKYLKKLGIRDKKEGNAMVTYRKNSKNPLQFFFKFSHKFSKMLIK